MYAVITDRGRAKLDAVAAINVANVVFAGFDDEKRAVLDALLDCHRPAPEQSASP